jgi:hypothetical protein
VIDIPIEKHSEEHRDSSDDEEVNIIIEENVRKI